MVAIFGAALIALSVSAVPTSVARAPSPSHALRFEIVKRTAHFDVVQRHRQRFRIKRHVRNVILNGVDRYRVVRRTRHCVVLRPVPRRTSTLNVRAYGATGNGRTDDTAIVQSAITAAAASGGVVYFPAGTYLVGPLTVPAGVVLQGVNGQGYYNATAIVPNVNTQSRLKLKSGSTGPLISPDDGGTKLATHVRIFDLALDCNGLAQPAINLPDRADSISRFWIVERCYVVNSGQSGSGYATYVGYGNDGVAFQGCVWFNGTSGSPAGHDGVGWYGQDGLMEDCFIGYCNNTGLKILGGASYMTFTIRGGGVFACTTGIVVAGRGAIIDGVSVDHNFNDGIYLGYGPCTVSNCTFQTNSRTATDTWSDIKIAGADQTFTVIGNHHEVESPEADGNVVKYFIDDATTGTVLYHYGNIVAPTARFGTAFTDYAGPAAE